jgi:hypothetical protein
LAATNAAADDVFDSDESDPAVAEDDDADRSERLLGGTSSFPDAEELLVTIGTSYDNDGEGSSEVFLELEYGVTDRLGVVGRVLHARALESNSVYGNAARTDFDALNDFSLAVTWAVLSEEPISVGTSFGVTRRLFRGEREPGVGNESQTVWEPSLVVDIALGDALFALEADAFLARDDSELDCAATLAYELTDFVASLGARRGLYGEDRHLVLFPGIGFEATDELDFTMEVPIGTESPSWGVLLELTLAF